MQKLSSRSYAGVSGETVSLSTTVAGSGAVAVTLDGAGLGSSRQFQLGQPGSQHQLTITLIGAVGETCGIGIATVNGSIDPDALIATVTDPFPMSIYSFRVGSTMPMIAMPGAAVAMAAATKRVRPAAKKTAAKTARKTAPKRPRARTPENSGGGEQ